MYQAENHVTLSVLALRFQRCLWMLRSEYRGANDRHLLRLRAPSGMVPNASGTGAISGFTRIRKHVRNTMCSPAIVIARRLYPYGCLRDEPVGSDRRKHTQPQRMCLAGAIADVPPWPTSSDAGAATGARSRQPVSVHSHTRREDPGLPILPGDRSAGKSNGRWGGIWVQVTVARVPPQISDVRLDRTPACE